MNVAMELHQLAGLLEPEAIEGYIEWFKTPNTFKM